MVMPKIFMLARAFLTHGTRSSLIIAFTSFIPVFSLCLDYDSLPDISPEDVPGSRFSSYP
jgi:hypothetical protein